MPDKRKDGGDTKSSATKKGRHEATKKKDKESSAAEDDFNYDPIHFIRSHSKNNDPADIQTQVTSLT